MRGSFWLRGAAIAVAIGLATSPRCRAEELDIVRCSSGTFNIFYESKEAKPLSSWSENAINQSNKSDKRLEGAVSHCEGIEWGRAPEATSYFFCKMVDTDGDAIIYGGSDTGASAQSKILEGTGKWKGITGSFHSEPIVASKPGKGAMPGTYQQCRHLKITFELPR